MRDVLLLGLLVGCYRPASLECAVSCADGAGCPNGLTCGATDQLCHAGTQDCSAAAVIDAGVAGDAALGDGSLGPPTDAPRGPFCVTDEANVVACYEFEGTANDSTAHHLDPTTLDVSYPAAMFGRALSVDQGSMVNIAETGVLDLQLFTVEAWLRQGASTSDNNVAVVNNVDQYGMFVDTVNEPYCAFFGPKLSVARAAVPLTLGRWTHVACTYDGVVLTLYVDGTAAAVNTDGGTVSTAGTLGTGIGSDAINKLPVNHYVGLIDNLKILSVAKSHAAICADAGRTNCP